MYAKHTLYSLHVLPLLKKQYGVGSLKPVLVETWVNLVHCANVQLPATLRHYAGFLEQRDVNNLRKLLDGDSECASHLF